MAAGLLKPKSGRISFNGFTPEAGAHKFHENLGVTFDRIPDFGNLTLFEIFEFALKLYGKKFDTDKIIETFAELGLDKYIHFTVSALSKGLQQKFGVLLATFHQPELLILDEPTSGLDPTSLLQIRKIVRSAASKGSSVLLSTHALEEVN